VECPRPCWIQAALDAAASLFLLMATPGHTEHSQRMSESTVEVAGVLNMDNGGELMFRPSPSSERRLPHYSVRAHSWIGFSNEQAALSVLGIADDVKRVDMVKFCALTINARLIVSEFHQGDGPSSAWYTVKFERAVSIGRRRFARCKT
jgi:hypothetical protein